VVEVTIHRLLSNPWHGACHLSFKWESGLSFWTGIIQSEKDGTLLKQWIVTMPKTTKSTTKKPTPSSKNDKKVAIPSFYIHPRGFCEETLGEGSRVWAHAHVMKNAVVGKNCNIGEASFVESGAVVGDGCTIKNGVSIWDGVTLEGDVFVGPNAVFTNDLVPRTKSVNPHYEMVRTEVKRGASIGANATIICGITLGNYCMVGAGAVVTKHVPDFALVYGTPARIQGWVSIKGERLTFNKKGKATDSDGNIYVKKKNTVSITERGKSE
jgi:UDP-2-acetamido-3-amino-2,3-dideoxy-glucuronate N-acetyltransferase